MGCHFCLWVQVHELFLWVFKVRGGQFLSGIEVCVCAWVVVNFFVQGWGGLSILTLGVRKKCGGGEHARGVVNSFFRRGGRDTTQF